jgi:hypothetical protein
MALVQLGSETTFQSTVRTLLSFGAIRCEGSVLIDDYQSTVAPPKRRNTNRRSASHCSVILKRAMDGWQSARDRD